MISLTPNLPSNPKPYPSLRSHRDLRSQLATLTANVSPRVTATLDIISASFGRLAISALCLLLPLSHAAAETLTPEPNPDSYNFVSHYRIAIGAPARQIWPVLLDFKSWMYEFELSTLSGEAGQVGHILRLYPNQEFKIQVTEVIPYQLVTIVNLPMTFRDEFTTGIGVITLHEMGNETEVSLTMSRRYTWKGSGKNPLPSTRLSKDFQSRTKAMWKDRFLQRLKTLAERVPDDA